MVTRLVVEIAVVEEGLGGNAPDVEAGAAEGAALLDAHRLEAHLRCLDRRHIPANGRHLENGSGSPEQIDEREACSQCGIQPRSS